MPFRYRCTDDDCEFDHHSPGLAMAHEANEDHECETYTVDETERER